MPDKVKVDNSDIVRRKRDMLMSMAEQCSDIANRLSDSGRPLNAFERKIVRLAQLPAIQEEFEIAVTRFILDGEVEEALQRLAEVMR